LLEYAPPKGAQDRAPVLANTVVVTGGTDALVLTFYHVSPGTLVRAFGNESAEHIERSGNRVTIRSEPIASVVLPFTVALDMIGSMLDTGVGGLTDIVTSVTEVGERFSKLGQQAELFRARVTGGNT